MISIRDINSGRSCSKVIKLAGCGGIILHVLPVTGNNQYTLMASAVLKEGTIDYQAHDT